MAEKEERIYVYRFIDDDGICPLEEFCTKFPGQCEHCKEIPTRTEAVEKMAKAFFKSWYGEGFEQEHHDLKRRYRESAEAALNALLEEDK